MTKYYYAGSQRIAMRKNGTLTYILGDHLGSTSLVTDSNGVVISETKYKAWGEIRYSSGTEQTKYTYTGQYSYTNDFGLMFYNARWYDPSLGRFAQADTIVPGGSQGLDRYSYTFNNPIIYTDPSGHCGIETDKNGKETVGKLDCTAKDIAKWSMEYRLRWFKLFTALTGADDWFHNIEGIIESFDENGLGETSSGEGADDWLSWTDAALLESIQNGYLGGTGNDAEKGWNNFFQAFKDDPTDRARLKELWGEAEEAGIEYGEVVAKGYGHPEAPDYLKDFLFVGNTYRKIAGVPYGGEILGSYVGAYASYLACGPLCVTGGALLGWNAGGAATYPGTDVGGHHPVYYISNYLINN
ncbi:MAG: RHS repeat-associated core domain-containing protein [Anaerolineales bacterium]|nr:RHS repeat-associated core domain-containing protein [Anaerolineales bacterium]